MDILVEGATGINRIALEREVQSVYRKVALSTKKGIPFKTGRKLAKRLGYPPGLLRSIPPEAINLFAGVGYFFHLAEIRPGERIVDLGCGTGMDAFIAALYTEQNGQVLGLDMTGEQLAKAAGIRDQYGINQVDFHQGNMDQLPVDENSVDMVISNGAINLAVNKMAVFREAARILKPGGRMVLADVVAQTDLPREISDDPLLWAARIGGAIPEKKYTGLMEKAGLKIVIQEDNPQLIHTAKRGRAVIQEYGIKSISLLAIKK